MREYGRQISPAYTHCISTTTTKTKKQNRFGNGKTIAKENACGV
jgi:hypothetical protein